MIAHLQKVGDSLGIDAAIRQSCGERRADRRDPLSSIEAIATKMEGENVLEVDERTDKVVKRGVFIEAASLQKF